MLVNKKIIIVRNAAYGTLFTARGVALLAYCFVKVVVLFKYKVLSLNKLKC